MERDGSKAQWMMKIALIGSYIMVESMGPVLRSPINCKISCINHTSWIMPSFASNTTKAMSQNSIQVGLISFSAVFGMIFPRKLNCSFPLEFVSSGHVSVGETRFCKCRVLGQMDDNIFNFLTDFSEQSHVGNSHQYGINLTKQHLPSGLCFIIRLKIKVRMFFAPK